MAILQNRRQTLGAAATLPEEAAKDLVLQVNLALLTAVLIIKHHHNSNRYLIFIVIIHFFLYIQGTCCIQIGCKLQEAASKYQYEGFSRIYVACTSTNTQKFIDLLETMFGDMDMDDINISKLEAETTRNLQKEAEMAEAASIATETRAIPKDKIMRVYVTSLPVPPEFRIPPQSLPETENVKERSVKNPAKKVTRFYYICHFCHHSSQNKASMMAHTQRCLNIKLVCAICSKAYDSSEYLEKHINDAHNGQCTSEIASMSTA